MAVPGEVGGEPDREKDTHYSSRGRERESGDGVHLNTALGEKEKERPSASVRPSQRREIEASFEVVVLCFRRRGQGRVERELLPPLLPLPSFLPPSILSLSLDMTATKGRNKRNDTCPAAAHLKPDTV